MRTSFPRSSIAASLLAAFVVIALLLSTSTANAQVAGTANIQGTISDSTGAVMANAVVTLTNQATQVKQPLNSSRDGVYMFPNISIGTYSPSRRRLQDLRADRHRARSRHQHRHQHQDDGRRNDRKGRGQVDRIALQTEDVSFKQTIDPADHRNAAQRPADDLAHRSLGRLATARRHRLHRAANTLRGYLGLDRRRQRQHTTGASTAATTTTGGQLQLPFPFPDAVAQFSVEPPLSARRTASTPAA